MEKVKIPEFKLIGLQLAEKTTNKNGKSMIDCGSLWQEFEKGKFFQKIPDKLDDKIYAVYFDYEGDHTQPFSYFIGCKVKSQTEYPQGLHSLIIPDQHYQKFTAKGKMPNCIAASWEEIWSSEIERDYGFDFEVYDERSQNWNDAEIDIFVSAC
ncbi:MAG: GyrI-like domain-containing protein [Cyclobacteriaceae bacterium]